MMQLLPIPTTDDAIKQSMPHWFPFLEHISKRSKESILELYDHVMKKEIQPIVIWDEHKQKVVALLGMSYRSRGKDIIAEWVWMTGTGYKQWQHLLPELERYVKEHVGCNVIRPVCRPGWSRAVLGKCGYKTTHYVMEKPL